MLMFAIVVDYFQIYKGIISSFAILRQVLQRAFIYTCTISQVPIFVR